MHTLRLFVSLPDPHAGIELRLSANDAPCDVVVAVPAAASTPAQPHDAEAPRSEQDDYVLGGYAGI